MKLLKVFFVQVSKFTTKACKLYRYNLQALDWYDFQTGHTFCKFSFSRKQQRKKDEIYFVSEIGKNFQLKTVI